MDEKLLIDRELLRDLLGDVVDYANSRMFKDREAKWRSDLIQKVSALLVESDKQEAVVDEAKGLLRLFYEACTACDPETGPYLDTDKLHEAHEALEAKGIQYLRGSDGNWPIAKTSDKQEAVDIVSFCELIDDYQIATINREEDEAAKARVTLMNAYRAALSAPLTHSAEQDELKRLRDEVSFYRSEHQTLANLFKHRSNEGQE